MTPSRNHIDLDLTCRWTPAQRAPEQLFYTKNQQPTNSPVPSRQLIARVRLVTEEWLRVLFVSVATNRLPPDVGTPSNESLSSGSRSNGWSDVEIEDGLAIGLRVSRVVVDDVSDLLLLTVDISSDIPIVAIKRGLSAVIEVSKCSIGERDFQTYPNFEG